MLSVQSVRDYEDRVTERAHGGSQSARTGTGAGMGAIVTRLRIYSNELTKGTKNTRAYFGAYVRTIDEYEPALCLAAKAGQGGRTLRK